MSPYGQVVPAGRAARSPVAIGFTAVGLVVALLTGVGLPGMIGIGAGAWAVGFVTARAVRPRRERIDPFAVGEPWRAFVQSALASQRRFEGAVGRVARGPLRERLADVGARVDHAVRECWRVARHGTALNKALADLDPHATGRELDRVRDELASAPDDARPALERQRQALEATLAAHDRIERVRLDARDRLQVLTAHLDEAVARALELSVSSTEELQLSPVAGDIDDVVGHLETLRLALDEVRGAAGPATS